MIKKNIAAKNLQIGLDYCFLKNEDFNIFFQNQCLSYKRDELLFAQNYLKNSETIYDIESSKFQNRIYYECNSFQELVLKSQNYDYLALEDSSLKYLFKDFGYISYDQYKNTKEGIRWQKIFKIQNDIINLNDLKSIEIFRENKEWNDFVFPLIYKEDIEILNLTNKELYKYFYKESPMFIPTDLNDEIFNKTYIEKNEKTRKIIDPSLVCFVENVLYIGNYSIENIDCISYKPKLDKCKEFQKKDVKLKSNSINEKQLIVNGNYSKLIAFQLNLSSSEKELYSQIMKYMRNDIKLDLERKPYGNWKKYLKIDSNFIKIYKKTIKIHQKTIDFIKKNDYKNIIYNNNYDFYIEKDNLKIAIDLKLNIPNISQIKANLLKIKDNLDEYYIVTEDNIINIELNSLKEPVNLVEKTTMYDDLFYWHRVFIIL